MLQRTSCYRSCGHLNNYFELLETSSFYNILKLLLEFNENSDPNKKEYFYCGTGLSLWSLTQHHQGELDASYWAQQKGPGNGAQL